jgi:homoserine O-succinyltransferase/O-acetyltransferase
MPITIPNNLPAKKLLEKENIFVMHEKRAKDQDIRPLEVAILNLMPTKIETEAQLARVLGNTPLQVNLTLLTTSSYQAKNTSKNHLRAFYKTWDEVKGRKFDGLIVTGAPIEQLKWDKVKYWDELTEIFDWSLTNVYSSFFICWGAQAALQHFHGVSKHELPKKKFGVFPHRIVEKNQILLRGFDDEFLVPVSRHTETRRKDIEKVKDLQILSESKQAGLYLVRHKKRRQVFAFNHPEYEAETLANEYKRDIKKGLSIDIPENYFPGNNPKAKPLMRWRAHANLIYSNWLNYYVYQGTPYDISDIR